MRGGPARAGARLDVRFHGPALVRPGRAAPVHAALEAARAPIGRQGHPVGGGGHAHARRARRRASRTRTAVSRPQHVAEARRSAGAVPDARPRPSRPPSPSPSPAPHRRPAEPLRPAAQEWLQLSQNKEIPSSMLLLSNMLRYSRVHDNQTEAPPLTPRPPATDVHGRGTLRDAPSHTDPPHRRRAHLPRPSRRR